MPCYKPLQGWRSRELSANGKRAIVFNPQKGIPTSKVKLPCGGCMGCRIDYSKQWAVRCMHEAHEHEKNCFITLTYNNDNMPSNKSVDKEELKKFFKRMRKHYGNHSFKYFGCGEYGDRSGRAHYHAIIFGQDFSEDRELQTKTPTGHLLYRSPTLETLWKKGFSNIGDVSFQSCAYVARYVMKKRKGDPESIDPKTGKTNAQYYEAMDEKTGEILELNPEFVLMSRGCGNRTKNGSNIHDKWKYGIGKTWWDQFKADTNKDFITIDRVPMSVPKYYDYLLEKENPQLLEELKEKRRQHALKNKDDNTRERLLVKERVLEAKLNQLHREAI